ncbi:hypothetical protein F5887DRAFT_1063958 [Amanita rubescens]|nr:hypothetical protein F5887DRAFT_1063958 [Amanita rubescens]
MDSLVAAYHVWCYNNRENKEGFTDSLAASSSEEVEKTADIILIDTYCIIPSAPYQPSYGVSTRVLELYKNLNARCPCLAIQPFVKGLIDLHGVRVRSSLSFTIFSTCNDVYLKILEESRKAVMKELNRDGPLWRIKNACPACSYQLHGEKELTFSVLTTMDGNNSLKRMRRDLKSEDDFEVDERRHERPDSRATPGDYYLTREEVDKWAKGVIEEELVKVMPSDEHNPCASRWKNMIDSVTSRMWGVFDETGIFLALCRHGFALVVADMVRSGELSKYPLAVVDLLLKAFGSNIGVGYDIGCKFATTVKKSPLGPVASQLNLRSLVGSFHGHAHGRLCQLTHLSTYTKGLGLEDLEGCERFFSKSNALANSVHYASKFLVNNYLQALEILKSEPSLKLTLDEKEISDPAFTFMSWLEEEKKYLENLATEPPEETLEMDYYSALVELGEYHMSDIHQRDRTRAIETKRRQTFEKRDRCLEHVHELERKLLIRSRWTPESPEWAAAAEKVQQRDYRRAVDVLEALVVSRLFELTKMNMSDICYKLQRHIAKSLQSRSHAIKKALDKYNEAAAAHPPAPALTWEQVVDYAFLSDFDLLRDARQDVREKPWACPLNRVLRDQYFKVERAQEEIKRLDVEIRRVITYIVDETEFLCAKEAILAKSNPIFAHQISVYRMERGRANALHVQRFEKLAKNPRFTGNITPGQNQDGQYQTSPED